MPKLYLKNPLAHLLGGENGAIAVTHFPWVIGRNPDCDLRLDSPVISRRHCRLIERDGDVWVQDLASLNGTSLNGEPVESPQPLHDGDQLLVACVLLEVHVPARVGAGSKEPVIPGVS